MPTRHLFYCYIFSCLVLLAFYINDNCPLAIFSTLASVILTTLCPLSFLVFLSFRRFPERLIGRLACFGQDGHMHRMAVIAIYRTKMPHCKLRRLIYEKDLRAGMPSFEKESSEPRFQRKWRRLQLWSTLWGVFTGSLMWINNLFLSLIREQLQKKTKQKTANRQKETVVIIICAYLSATHWIFFVVFYVISNLNKFVC